MKTLSDITEIVCTNPLDKLTWGEWKRNFELKGLTVVADYSEFEDSEVVRCEAASLAISLCKLEIKDVPEQPFVPDHSVESHSIEIVEKSLSVREWRDEYTRLTSKAPIGQILRAENGAPIRVEVTFPLNKEPFIFTRAYVPKIVGAKLGWFAQSKKDENSYGWKVIFLNKARDELIRRLGIANDIVYVKAIEIVTVSNSNLSLLCQVAEW